MKTAMGKKNNIVEFVIFCVENTAARLGVHGSDVYRSLKNTDGIASFLFPSYEALHTQSKEYMVDETLQYLRQHHSPLMGAKGGMA